MNTFFMNRLALLLILLILAVSICHAQDKIYKKTGEVLETKVLEIGVTEIKYKVFTNQSGPIYVLPKTELLKIVYENGSMENITTDVIELNTADLKRAQNIYVEFAGQGLLITANYDTRFGKRRNGLGGRIGFGAFGADGESFVSVPVSLNYLLGNGKHFFEIGLGATYAWFSEGDEIFANTGHILGTTAFMYRLQPIKNGFSARVGLTPVFDNNIFIPYAGYSLGYIF